MEKGDVVIVMAYGGERLTRRVVADLGRTVIVCSEAEYKRASLEGRDPQGVGFPAEDVARESAKKTKP